MVVALAEGKALEEIAKQGNVTANTVRTQLKQAISKTDSRHQAELTKSVTALS